MAFLYFNISTNIYILIFPYQITHKGMGQLVPISKRLSLSKGLMSVFAAFLYSPIEPLEIYSSLHVFRKVFFPMITVSMRLEEIKTSVAASPKVVFFFWLGTSETNFSQMLKFNQRDDLCCFLNPTILRLRCMLQIPRRPSLFSLHNTIFSHQIASRLVMTLLRWMEVHSVITAHTTSAQVVPVAPGF